MQFGQYTLEAIIIYVLGMAFDCIQESSIVRVSTLLGLLDRTVRTQAFIINKNKKESINEESQFEIGKILLEFMIERNIIYIESITSDDKKAVVKKKGVGYLESNLFAVCNFYLSILPLKLNFPMVCKPLDWGHPDEELAKSPI